MLNYTDPKTASESSTKNSDESSSDEEESTSGQSKKQAPCVDFRHYLVTAVPTGISKPVKKLIKAKVPKLGLLEDISQYMLNPDALSDSEISDMEDR